MGWTSILQPHRGCSRAPRWRTVWYPHCLDGRSPKTMTRHDVEWSAPQQWIPHCSLWSGSHKGPHQPGMAASCAACPFCLQAIPAARFLHHRYRPLPRGAGKCRNPSLIRRRSGRPARRHTPRQWRLAALLFRGCIRHGYRCSRHWRSSRNSRSGTPRSGCADRGA